MLGRIHSFQSLGTVDGPGVRFVVFTQGCPLRCGCCHNPDTWDMRGGEEYTALAVVQKAERYREYFSDNGGITVSGGEPLVQAAFVTEIFSLCRERGIHTCLDTSGALFNDSVDMLLDVTDRVLLDIKYTNSEQYREYVGCEFQTVLHFLEQLEKRRIPTTLRYVLLPQLNDSEEALAALREIVQTHACVDGVEILPFHKMCQSKYDLLQIPFRFAHVDVPSAQQVSQAQKSVTI